MGFSENSILFYAQKQHFERTGTDYKKIGKGRMIVIENILFALLIIVFIGFGVVLLVEEKKNFKRLKDSD